MNRLNIKAPLSTIVAIVVAAVVLIGYFLPDLPWVWIPEMLLSIAVLLSAVALLLGVANLFTVHLSKITTGSRTALYSAVLLGSLFITFILTIFLGPQAALPMWLFTYIQVPIEISLMAVLTFSLTFAALRLVIRRPGGFSLIFIAVFLLTLLGSGPVFGLDFGSGPASFFSNYFVSAGARGILLGVALGSVATGLRILLGADRPFGG